MPGRLIMKRAFTVTELFIVVACVMLLAGILLPHFMKGRSCTGTANCLNNLKQIGLSFRTWALDNSDNFPMRVSEVNGGTMELVNGGAAFIHFLVMSNELSTPQILICPQEVDPNRTYATTFATHANANQIPFNSDRYVSYFVGVDANENEPSRWLCGDRNLAFDGVPATHGLHSIWSNSLPSWVKPRHANFGNIGFADGSVQQLGDSGLRSSLGATGMATNRLAVP
jgi:prepilin-type processing-associated H-X9-DG protein